MKTIMIRMLIFALCAMVLGFISHAGFNVEEGKVFVVGRCQVSLQNVGPESLAFEKSSGEDCLNHVGIAQVELESNEGEKPVFKVVRIFSVKTDENGYFMIKNLSNEYTYVLLGFQYQKNTPVPVHFLTLANAREKQGKMVNLGYHQVVFAKGEDGRKIVTAKIDTSVKNEEFVRYFIGRSPLRTFVSQIKSDEFWGRNNAVTVIDTQKVVFSNLDSAPWHSCSTN